MIFFSTKIKICSNSTFINKKKYNFGLYELLNKPVVQEKMDRLINDRTKFSIIIEEQNISQETINKIKTVFTNHLTRCELIKDSHNQYYFKKKLLSLSITCQILIICACLIYSKHLTKS